MHIYSAIELNHGANASILWVGRSASKDGISRIPWWALFTLLTSGSLLSAGTNRAIPCNRLRSVMHGCPWIVFAAIAAMLSYGCYVAINCVLVLLFEDGAKHYPIDIANMSISFMVCYYIYLSYGGTALHTYWAIFILFCGVYHTALTVSSALGHSSGHSIAFNRKLTPLFSMVLCYVYRFTSDSLANMWFSNLRAERVDATTVNEETRHDIDGGDDLENQLREQTSTVLMEEDLRQDANGRPAAPFSFLSIAQPVACITLALLTAVAVMIAVDSQRALLDPEYELPKFIRTVLQLTFEVTSSAGPWLGGFWIARADLYIVRNTGRNPGRVGVPWIYTMLALVPVMMILPVISQRVINHPRYLQKPLPVDWFVAHGTVAVVAWLLASLIALRHRIWTAKEPTNEVSNS